MFSENKGFSIYVRFLQNLKAFELTWLTLKTCLKFMKFYWLISKQTWESFVFTKHCDWTIFHVSWLDCLRCNITNESSASLVFLIVKKTKLAELSWYYFYEYSDSNSLLATTKKGYNFENIMNSLLESMWLLLTWFYYKEQKIMTVEKYVFSDVFFMFLLHR